MAAFEGVLEKLTRHPEEIRAENCREWARSIPEVTPIRDLVARQPCKAAGVIGAIRIDPRPGVGAVEATITDGTGELTVRWLGRLKLAGIRLGRGLVVSGTPGRRDGDELVILNPEYELVLGPEHG